MQTGWKAKILRIFFIFLFNSCRSQNFDDNQIMLVIQESDYAAYMKPIRKTTCKY